LDAWTLGQVDLPDAVADVLHPHRAEEREVDEGVAVERAAWTELDVGRALGEALRAHGAAGEEVFVAVEAARAEEVRRLVRIVRDGEVAGLHGDARCHGASELQPWRARCQSLAVRSKAQPRSHWKRGLVHAPSDP